MLEKMAYPGGKSGPGVYHRLINLMPPHAVYCEPFLGAGGVMRRKLPAPYNIGVDMDAAVIAEWRSRIGEAAGIGSPAASGSARGNADSAGVDARRVGRFCSLGGNDERRHNLVAAAISPSSAEPPPVDRPTRYRFLRGDALTFLASYPFEPDHLIYCDPPYLMETRSSGRLYRHEFSDEQHAELLSTIVELPCRVMISGYWSELYASRLHRWNSIHFEAMTRGGMATEWVWFNFEPPVALHDYRYLGETAHQRQDLKRMVASWAGKLERMPPLKKQALLSAIADIGGSAARIRE